MINFYIIMFIVVSIWIALIAVAMFNIPESYSKYPNNVHKVGTDVFYPIEWKAYDS